VITRTAKSSTGCDKKGVDLLATTNI